MVWIPACSLPGVFPFKNFLYQSEWNRSCGWRGCRQPAQNSRKIGLFHSIFDLATFLEKTTGMAGAANLEKPVSFYFWEKSPVSEVDLVINSQGMTIPVEIKYSTSFDKKYIHALQMFKEKHKVKKLNIPFSLIIYRGEFQALDENIFCLPVWTLV